MSELKRFLADFRELRKQGRIQEIMEGKFPKELSKEFINEDLVYCGYDVATHRFSPEAHPDILYNCLSRGEEQKENMFEAETFISENENLTPEEFARKAVQQQSPSLILLLIEHNATSADRILRTLQNSSDEMTPFEEELISNLFENFSPDSLVAGFIKNGGTPTSIYLLQLAKIYGTFNIVQDLKETLSQHKNGRELAQILRRSKIFTNEDVSDFERLSNDYDIRVSGKKKIKPSEKKDLRKLMSRVERHRELVGSQYQEEERKQ